MVAGHVDEDVTMQTKRSNILHHLSIYPSFVKQSVSQRSWTDKETHTKMVGVKGCRGDDMSLFLCPCDCTANDTNHLWSCWRHTIKNWVICIYVFVCDHSATTVYTDGHSRLQSPSLYAWKADSYMWYFALGGALHDHWPIYWYTQEAPRCHSTKSSRCNKDGEH